MTLTFDLWPFAWTSLLSMVITPENFMMIWWHCTHVHCSMWKPQPLPPPGHPTITDMYTVPCGSLKHYLLIWTSNHHRHVCFSIVIYTDWPCALSSPRLDKFAHYKSPLQCKPDISRLGGSKQWYRDISESAIYRATVMSPNQAPFTSALWAIMGLFHV